MGLCLNAGCVAGRAPMYEEESDDVVAAAHQIPPITIEAKRAATPYGRAGSEIVGQHKWVDVHAC